MTILVKIIRSKNLKKKQALKHFHSKSNNTCLERNSHFMQTLNPAGVDTVYSHFGQISLKSTLNNLKTIAK